MFLARRLKYHMQRLNKRKNKHMVRGGDKIYGKNPDISDLDDEF